MRAINSNEMAFVVGGDAAATRLPGANSWGEQPSRVECTSKTEITIDEKSTANNGEASCVLSSAPPFLKCDVVVLKTGGTITTNKRTVIECPDKRSSRASDHLQKIQYFGM